jgi:hypothetical protein
VRLQIVVSCLDVTGLGYKWRNEMRKLGLAVFGVIFVVMLIAQGVGAFEVGENCAENGGFEASEPGSMPAEWVLRVSG